MSTRLGLTALGAGKAPRAAKIWNLPNAAAAGLRRVWYLTAITCPAEPGAFVVEAGPRRYTAVTFGVNPHLHGVNEAEADRQRSPPKKDRLGGDDGQFLLRHLPGRTQ